METVVLYGDSITDMSRDRSQPCENPFSLGFSYSFIVSAYLNYYYPNKFRVINSGIGGDQITHLITRAPSELFKYNPKYISILIGVNDCYGDFADKVGSDIKRFEKYYRCLLDEIKERLPDAKVMILECFACRDVNCSEDEKRYLQHLKEYAEVERKLANEYNLEFIPLFDELTKLAKENGSELYLYDGTHPNAAGAMYIATNWIEHFKKISNIK